MTVRHVAPLLSDLKAISSARATESAKHPPCSRRSRYRPPQYRGACGVCRAPCTHAEIAEARNDSLQQAGSSRPPRTRIRERCGRRLHSALTITAVPEISGVTPPADAPVVDFCGRDPLSLRSFVGFLLKDELHDQVAVFDTHAHLLSAGAQSSHDRPMPTSQAHGGRFPAGIVWYVQCALA